MESCKKTKFVDEISAKFFIAKIKRTSNRDKIPNRAYLCNICNSWHLTSRINFQEEISKLTDDLAKRDLRILELENKLKELELRLSKEGREITKATRANEQIIALKKGLHNANKKIKELRNDYHTLLPKYLKAIEK